MGLIVQKYGGTSVANVARILHVARKVKATRQMGHEVVVVVSAMGEETDRLEALAYQIMETPSPRELDVLLATGEQVSIALLCMALHAIGCPAKSYLGHQVPIQTDSSHTKAQITYIDGTQIRSDIADGKVVVIAGFQGIDRQGEITTLGRGGSDTTAAALASFLNADECQIYTDVDGVYTTDPKVVPEARRMVELTVKEMLALSSLGAEVLQTRAVEFAAKHSVPLRVRSTFKEGPGTLIVSETRKKEGTRVSGIAFSREAAKLILSGVPERAAGTLFLDTMKQLGVEVDMIAQVLGEDERTHFTLVVRRPDYKRTLTMLQALSKEWQAKGVIGDPTIAKVSLVGVGIGTQAGVTSTLFQALGRAGINIQLMSASDIKVSIVIDEKDLELAVRVLHEAFHLHQEPPEEEEHRYAIVG